jgi:hypothetical protein
MAFISEVESIFIQRLYTGWITLRNQTCTPVKMMGRRVIELYDALIAGNDFEITPLLSLKRRAGHTLLTAINSAALYLYSWKSNTQGTIPIFDTLTDVEYYNGTATVSILTKTLGAGLNIESSILGIGNYLYIGNPQVSKKWDGPAGEQGLTNWGLSIGLSGVAGPNTAGTGANGTGPFPWTNPGNVTSAVNYAVNTFTNLGTSNQLKATNFGFSIPTTSAVVGCVVTFDAYCSLAGNQLTVRLLPSPGGFSGGTPKILTLSTTPGTTYTLGTSSDIWSAPLGASIVSSSYFGVEFQGMGAGPFTPITYDVRNVRITIYTIPSTSVIPTGIGTFSAVNGYTYVYAYGNSVSGEVSNASGISGNTGPFNNVAYVAITIVASTDPQVNQIRVYRTTDSGGGNIFFEIANSPFPNTSATVQDTTPDTSLQVTSQAEVNLGNTPPPAGLTNLAWWSGRMWGSVNNLLYASTGPETISGTAPNSNWNPDFQYLIPGTITKLVPAPNGMIVFTLDDSYIVRGTDITNYTINEYVKDLGLRSFNALDTDGSSVYMFTSDRQFVVLSAAGENDLGQTGGIADQLASVDPTQCYVSMNRYGLDSIVRILDTVNNVYYDYNVNQQCWNLPGILQMPDCTAMGSIEVSPGVWRLLVSSTSGAGSSLAYRDITNFQDLGTSYAPNAVFGSIQLADPGSLAKFGALAGFAMQYTEAGTAPALSVLLNDIGCVLSNAVGSQITTAKFISLNTPKNAFEIPPTLGNQPTGYRNLGYYLSQSTQRMSGFAQNLQFLLAAPAENTALELIGFGIYGDLKQEVGTAGQLPQIQGR